jgi:Protein of unknown function (DUF3105)
VRRPAIAVLATAVGLAGCGVSSTTSGAGSGSAEGVPAPEGIPGVLAYSFQDRYHIEGPIDYPLHPPVGGNHNPVYANCHFYDGAIPDENAVHSLEHGAVWIAYSAELPAADKQALEERVDGDGYLLALEYPDLDSRLVLTAWNRRLALDSMDDPRFEEFIDTYRLGPTMPEPGGGCSGGAG